MHRAPIGSRLWAGNRSLARFPFFQVDLVAATSRLQVRRVIGALCGRAIGGSTPLPESCGQQHNLETGLTYGNASCEPYSPVVNPSLLRSPQFFVRLRSPDLRLAKN
jgi:hypothetical protein